MTSYSDRPNLHYCWALTTVQSRPKRDAGSRSIIIIIIRRIIKRETIISFIDNELVNKNIKPGIVNMMVERGKRERKIQDNHSLSNTDDNRE